jgi:DNA-binding response OmpR family regulator
MARILVIEDEEELSKLILKWLRDELHTAEAAYDGVTGLQKIQNGGFDLIVLDIMLPELDGISLLKQYRSAGGAVPVIILTAKRTLEVKEEGLDNGADDFLTKPFKLRELSARIRALLRRPANILPTLLRVEDLTLDPAACKVFRGDQEVRLVPKEFSLLEVLMRNAGQLVKTEYLITSVWGTDSNISQETIRSYVRLLRQKLDVPGQTSLIENFHGVGYKIGAGDVQ